MWIRTSAALLLVLVVCQVDRCGAAQCCDSFCISFRNETACNTSDGLSACPDQILSNGLCSCLWLSLNTEVKNYACIARITLPDQEKLAVTTTLVAALAAVGGVIFCGCFCLRLIWCCGYEEHTQADRVTSVEEWERRHEEHLEDNMSVGSVDSIDRSMAKGRRRRRFRQGLSRMYSIVTGRGSAQTGTRSLEPNHAGSSDHALSSDALKNSARFHTQSGRFNASGQSITSGQSASGNSPERSPYRGVGPEAERHHLMPPLVPAGMSAQLLATATVGHASEAPRPRLHVAAAGGSETGKHTEDGGTHGVVISHTRNEALEGAQLIGSSAEQSFRQEDPLSESSHSFTDKGLGSAQTNHEKHY